MSVYHSVFRWRRVIQVAVLLLFLVLPWLNRGGLTGVKGSLFAFDLFGVPFADPLGAVQVLLAGAVPGWRLVVGGGLALVLALCLGRVFCSWLCPFGLLSELVQRVRGFLKRPAGLPKGLGGGFRFRAVVAVLGLVLVPVLGFPVLNQLSLPGGVSLGLLGLVPPPAASVVASPALPAVASTGAGLWLLLFLPVLTVLLAEAVTGKRLWCRWLCPQSVLLALMAWLPVAPRLRHRMSRCVCRPVGAFEGLVSDSPPLGSSGFAPSGVGPACRAACPLGLNPRNPRSSSPLECTSCGACVLACAHVHRGEPAALSLASPCLSVGRVAPARTPED